MKTSAFLLFTLVLLLAAGLRANAQAGGIGIGTSQPEGALHVKAGGKDVVIAHETGNLGIHTTDPQAKVDVAGSVQIIDGLQAEGRILTSDKDGNARWTNPIGSAGKLETVLELGPQDISPGDSVDVGTSHFTVLADGYHVYEIRWYATYASQPSRQIYTATLLQLIHRSPATETDIVADQFEMYRDITTAADDAVTFWTSLSAQAKAGDELFLIVCPGIAHGNLLLKNDDNLTTSKIIIKRLNMR